MPESLPCLIFAMALQWKGVHQSSSSCSGIVCVHCNGMVEMWVFLFVGWVLTMGLCRWIILCWDCVGILCLEGAICIGKVFDDEYVWIFCIKRACLMMWREKRVRGWEWRESDKERDRISGEGKKIEYKIQMNINCVNIHNYCNNNGYLDNFGLIDVGNVWSKMCKTCYFFEFTKAGVIAFRLSLVGRVK